jgi:transcription termination factor 2
MSLQSKVDNFINWIKKSNLDLKPHQLSGIRWCLLREHNIEPIYLQPNMPFRCPMGGGILGDEMGLGKTILMIGAIVANPKKRTLIVLPNCLVKQWTNVLNNLLTDDFPMPLVFHGSKVKSPTILKQIQNNRIVITTYGMISIRKSKLVKKKVNHYKCALWDIEWDRIIFDEAHHLRNRHSNVHKGAQLLSSFTKWFVTGTPIQNHSGDMYSLLSLLNYTHLLHIGEVETMNAIKAIYLRRTKKSIKQNMVNCEEMNIPVYYKNEAEKRLATHIHSLCNFSTIDVNNVDNIINLLDGKGVFPIYSAARQVCILPNMLTNKWIENQVNNIIPWDMDVPQINSSSKIDAIVDTIKLHKNTGRKIIFAHYHAEIDLIYNKLFNAGISVCKYDGRITNKKRHFNAASTSGWADMFIYRKNWSNEIVNKAETIKMLVEPFLAPTVLIIQIQSGCEGLNLQHFNEVYFTSPHWNPAVEMQAIARVHRIGQTKPVRVFRFITEFDDDTENPISIDQYALKVQSVKKTVIDKFNTYATKS